MHFSYLLYQAERVKSPREQHEADVRAGERAKSFAELWHSLLPARRALARGQRGRIHRAVVRDGGTLTAGRGCQPLSGPSRLPSTSSAISSGRRPSVSTVTVDTDA